MIKKTQRFKTRSLAKCIISGEHSVLRGCPAIVKSLSDYYLELNYISSDQTMNIEIETTNNYKYFRKETLASLFLNTLQNALRLLNKDMNLIKGNFLIKTNIPVCIGLGFSAALCVSIARWLLWKTWIRKPDLFQVARKLEDDFHGKSSGVDIAGSISEKTILFKVPHHIEPLNIAWHPKLFLTTTEIIGVTADAVDKVNQLFKQDVALGKALDHKMEQSVLNIQVALQRNGSFSFDLLAQAIRDAKYCFEQWDLITKELENVMDYFLETGAVAVKPTGSGKGGSVLSLWKREPPNHLQYILKPIFL